MIPQSAVGRCWLEYEVKAHQPIPGNFTSLPTVMVPDLLSEQRQQFLCSQHLPRDSSRCAVGVKSTDLNQTNVCRFRSSKSLNLWLGEAILPSRTEPSALPFLG